MCSSLPAAGAAVEAPQITHPKRPKFGPSLYHVPTKSAAAGTPLLLSTAMSTLMCTRDAAQACGTHYLGSRLRHCGQLRMVASNTRAIASAPGSSMLTKSRAAVANSFAVSAPGSDATSTKHVALCAKPSRQARED